MTECDPKEKVEVNHKPKNWKQHARMERAD